MDMTNIILLALAGLVLFLYMGRRRARLKHDDFD